MGGNPCPGVKVDGRTVVFHTGDRDHIRPPQQRLGVVDTWGELFVKLRGSDYVGFAVLHQPGPFRRCDRAAYRDFAEVGFLFRFDGCDTVGGCHIQQRPTRYRLWWYRTVYDLALWVQVDNPQGYGPIQRKEARYFRTREVGDYGIFFGVYGTGYVGAVKG